MRTYSDYLRAAREAEKEDTIELSWSPRAPVTVGPSKLRATRFFPLRKLNGNQLFMKKPAMHLTQLPMIARIQREMTQMGSKE